MLENYFNFKASYYFGFIITHFIVLIWKNNLILIILYELIIAYHSLILIILYKFIIFSKSLIIINQNLINFEFSYFFSLYFYLFLIIIIVSSNLFMIENPIFLLTIYLLLTFIPLIIIILFTLLGFYLINYLSYYHNLILISYFYLLKNQCLIFISN